MKDFMPVRTGSRALNVFLALLIFVGGFTVGRILYRVIEGGGF